MTDLSLQKKAQRLRIYISERDQWRGNSLDSALLETMRENGMAGATVYRCIAGFGAHSRIHTMKIEVFSTDLPIVIDVIDTPIKINEIIEIIYPMVREGLITIEDVEIVKYTHRFLNPLPSDRLVSEVMTKDVTTFRVDMPIHQAWKQMLEKQIKAIPVISETGMVVGIMTDEDLLERAGIQQRLSVAIRMNAAEINQELKTLESSPLKVEDVMTEPVVTVFAKDTLGYATQQMVKSGLKRLPVINQDGKLVGILSRLDILRQVANSQFVESPATLHKGAFNTVEDVMCTNIPMANQDDDLATLIDKFSKTESHRLIVVDAVGKAIGLISDSDVVARVQPAKQRNIIDAFRQIRKPVFGKETAFDLMSPGPLTGAPDLPVVDAIKLMLANARKWLVVVDKYGKPLGLVDRQILLESIASFHDKS